MDKILVIGDLHDYDANLGSHKNYPENVTKVKTLISEVVARVKPTQVILTGDLCGVNFTKNFKSISGLFNLATCIDVWGKFSGSPVISIMGNHDASSKPTAFDTLKFFNKIKTFENTEEKGISYLDYKGLRLHLCNYGDEELDYNIKDNAKNIAITHADFQTRETDWYKTKGGYQLNTMSNMRGIDFIIGGHIHIPSPKRITESIDGYPIELLYLGCPTRPTKSTYNKCPLAVIEVDDSGNVGIDLEMLDLGNWEDLYTVTEETVEFESEEFVSHEMLKEILTNTAKYFSKPDTYNEFLDRYKKTDPEAVEKALEYLEG